VQLQHEANEDLKPRKELKESSINIMPRSCTHAHTQAHFHAHAILSKKPLLNDRKPNTQGHKNSQRDQT
jgi:hypothetical protein